MYPFLGSVAISVRCFMLRPSGAIHRVTWLNRLSWSKVIHPVKSRPLPYPPRQSRQVRVSTPLPKLGMMQCRSAHSTSPLAWVSQAAERKLRTIAMCPCHQSSSDKAAPVYRKGEPVVLIMPSEYPNNALGWSNGAGKRGRQRDAIYRPTAPLQGPIVPTVVARRKACTCSSLKSLETSCGTRWVVIRGEVQSRGPIEVSVIAVHDPSQI
jgi:hypothetical protein